MEKIANDAIFWGAISDAEKLKLVNIFTGLGPHSVKIASNGNTDCVELARDLKDCFKKAGWVVHPTKPRSADGRKTLLTKPFARAAWEAA